MSFPLINFEHACKISSLKPELIICGDKIIWEEDGYENFINIYQVQHQTIKDNLPIVNWYFYLAGDFLTDDENSTPLAVRFEEIYDQDSKFFIDRRGAYIQHKNQFENPIEIKPRVHDAIIQLSQYINKLTYINERGFLCIGEGTCGYGEKDGEYYTSLFDIEVVQEMKDDGMWEPEIPAFQTDLFI